MTIEDYLAQLHPGQWFSFDGEKTLEKAVLTDFGKKKGYTLPTQADFDAWKAAQEQKETERQQKVQKRREAKERIKGSPPPNSMPGLAERVKDLEIATGIKDPEL